MSLAVVWRAAFKKREYTYGLWRVSKGVITFKGEEIVRIKPRLNKNGVWLEVISTEFKLSDPFVNGQYQTIRAIERMQQKIQNQVTYNGVLIHHITRRHGEDHANNHTQTHH